MKIAVYSPYLDTASGGEKYMLTIAEVLAKEHQVEVLLDAHLWRMGPEMLKVRNEERHGLDLSGVSFIESPMGAEAGAWKRWQFLRQYDWLFVNTDGGIFASGAKNSVLHFQLPLDRVEGNGLIGQLKLRSWRQAVYNSEFTKRAIEKLIKIKGEVVYPPVDIERFSPDKKEPMIVSVGRFAVYGNPKKHDVMIKMFKQMIDDGLKGWSLHLAGGVMAGNEQFLEDLKELAKGVPVHFYPNISLPDLVKLYGKATIYWHAMGFGEDDPKKFEHFGISTVEAMAAGCVPVVINKGGQSEIVEVGVSGLLWDNLEECRQQTTQLIKDDQLRQELALGAQSRAQHFSKARFAKQIKELVNG